MNVKIKIRTYKITGLVFNEIKSIKIDSWHWIDGSKYSNDDGRCSFVDDDDDDCLIEVTGEVNENCIFWNFLVFWNSCINSFLVCTSDGKVMLVILEVVVVVFESDDETLSM